MATEYRKPSKPCARKRRNRTRIGKLATKRVKGQKLVFVRSNAGPKQYRAAGINLYPGTIVRHTIVEMRKTRYKT